MGVRLILVLISFEQGQWSSKLPDWELLVVVVVTFLDDEERVDGVEKAEWSVVDGVEKAEWSLVDAVLGEVGPGEDVLSVETQSPVDSPEFLL